MYFLYILKVIHHALLCESISFLLRGLVSSYLSSVFSTECLGIFQLKLLWAPRRHKSHLLISWFHYAQTRINSVRTYLSISPFVLESLPRRLDGMQLLVSNQQWTAFHSPTGETKVFHDDRSTGLKVHVLQFVRYPYLHVKSQLQQFRYIKMYNQKWNSVCSASAFQA